MIVARAGSEPGIRKIAVLRANGIGDFLLAVPALQALHATYPAAEITLLGKPWHAPFLAGRPGPVDRVIVVPPSRGVRDELDVVEKTAELEQFFEVMAQEGFDLAIQLHGGGRYSNPFVLRLDARMTIGLKSPEAAALDRWVPYIYFQSEILRCLEVVSLVGATTVVLEPRLVVTAADLDEAQRLVPNAEKPLALLHPGATDPRRRWPVEKLAAVGDALALAGAHVVVSGTEPERALVEAVVNRMGVEAQNVCGRLSLGGLAGLLSRCRVVVSNDSGPLHLAAAVGAATVGIYWCGNLINAGPFFRARHRPAISWRLACPVCGLDCTCHECDHRASFVADVPTEEVVASALDLFHEPWRARSSSLDQLNGNSRSSYGSNRLQAFE